MLIGPPLSCPRESMSRLLKGHRGVPVLASKTPPIPQPLAIHPRGPEKDAGVGICHRALMTRLRVTLKSDNPLIRLGSYHGTMALGLFAQLSPAKLLEVVSK